MFRKLFGRTQPEFEIFVQDGNRQIDLYPIAQEVIERAPDPCGMDALRLAELARRRYFGEYVRVGEYPPEIDREYVKLVIGRVVRWARWIGKAEGFARTGFTHYSVRTGHEPCKAMAALSGQVIPKSEITRLPLNDCWRHCQCWYRLGTKRR